MMASYVCSPACPPFSAPTMDPITVKDSPRVAAPGGPPVAMPSMKPSSPSSHPPPMAPTAPPTCETRSCFKAGVRQEPGCSGRLWPSGWWWVLGFGGAFAPAAGAGGWGVYALASAERRCASTGPNGQLKAPTAAGGSRLGCGVRRRGSRAGRGRGPAWGRRWVSPGG